MFDAQSDKTSNLLLRIFLLLNLLNERTRRYSDHMTDNWAADANLVFI
jgi:hypothetical protein